MSLAQRDAFFTWRVRNDRHYACLSNKSFHINELHLFWDTLYIYIYIYIYICIYIYIYILYIYKVTVTPIVIGALGTVTRGFVQGLEDLEITGRVETIQTSVLLRSTRILRRVLETYGDLLPLRLQWKTISWSEKLSNEQKKNYNKEKGQILQESDSLVYLFSWHINTW